MFNSKLALYYARLVFNVASLFYRVRKISGKIISVVGVVHLSYIRWRSLPGFEDEQGDELYYLIRF